MLDHIKQRRQQLADNIQSSYVGEQLTVPELEKAATDFFEKGGRGAGIGEIRKFGGRDYIKTPTGWKFHGKGTGTKTKAHNEGQKVISSAASSFLDDAKKKRIEKRDKEESKYSADDHNKKVQFHEDAAKKLDKHYGKVTTASKDHLEDAARHRKLAQEKSNNVEESKKRPKTN